MSDLIEFNSERKILRDKKRIVMLAEEIMEMTAEDVIKDLEILSLTKEPITMILASPGGEVYSGYAIIRAIKKIQEQGIKVTGEVHGHAMSMAFFILQCCDYRVMGKLCKMMCHGVTTFTVGDIHNIESESKIMRMFRDEMAELVANRSTSQENKYKTAKYWKQILEDNTPQFYDSKECLEKGLVDEVR